MRAGLLLSLLLAAPGAAAGPANPVYDPIVDAVVARYHLPGIAVGVIEDGQVVYTATRGETVAGSGHPVTSQTLFKIASNSKAMTTALLGRLVDEGKLAWDDPVTKYLPDFRMADPWVTRHMRVADLLTHSSGLPEGGGDLMLWPEPNAFTRADIIHGLRYIEPGYSFRSQYQYDNLLYVVAGEVAAAAAGAPYETLMHSEVFAPLGLSRCQVGTWSRDAVGNLAQPHYRKDGRNRVMREDGPTIPAITSDPAGGIRCDLTDMLRWAKNWLVPTPAQLKWLSSTQRQVLQSPHMLIPVSDQRRAWDHTHVMAYGYGWRMADVDGQWVVWHTGTLGGMYSMLALLPDRKSGFVFMINGEAEDARTVLG
ncbi:MAG TPA: serine hydrolase domain-containing protein, partial [Frateuria sp.]|uniref:serine hydrolase domain-containing protein n=1 Tax=Frateuria sp. TaxID=2211372 RepID=UPI002D80E86B